MSHSSFKSSLPLWWNVDVVGNWEVIEDFRIRKEEIVMRIKVIDDLEEEGRLEEGMKEECLALKVELAKVVQKKTSSWRQKAKIRWIKEGDSNSAFFHRWANGRKIKNFIDFLENENEEKLKGDKKIEEGILSFFSNLYGPEMESKPFMEGIERCPISEREGGVGFLFYLGRN